MWQQAIIPLQSSSHHHPYCCAHKGLPQIGKPLSRRIRIRIRGHRVRGNGWKAFAGNATDRMDCWILSVVADVKPLPASAVSAS